MFVACNCKQFVNGCRILGWNKQDIKFALEIIMSKHRKIAIFIPIRNKAHQVP